MLFLNEWLHDDVLPGKIVFNQDPYQHLRKLLGAHFQVKGQPAQLRAEAGPEIHIGHQQNAAMLPHRAIPVRRRRDIRPSPAAPISGRSSGISTSGTPSP